MIVIARMGGRDANDLLNIELWPDNTVVAAHYRQADRDYHQATLAREKLQASAQVVKRLRETFWRVRPEDHASAQNSVPLGCHYVYDAGFDWEVVFVRPDKPAGSQLLEFVLPYPEYCQSAAAAKARTLINDAIQALPRSNVIQQFPSGRYHPLGTYSS